MDVQKAAQTQTAISGQNTAIVSEHIDKQLGSRDPGPGERGCPEFGLEHSGSEQINQARMDNSRERLYLL